MGRASRAGEGRRQIAGVFAAQRDAMADMATVTAGAVALVDNTLAIVRETTATLRSNDQDEREAAAAALDLYGANLTQQLETIRARWAALKAQL